MNHAEEASMGAFAILALWLREASGRTPAEQEELMVKMTEARAAEVLPREALEEVPMTHFSTRGER